MLSSIGWALEWIEDFDISHWGNLFSFKILQWWRMRLQCWKPNRLLKNHSSRFGYLQPQSKLRFTTSDIFRYLQFLATACIYSLRCYRNIAGGGFNPLERIIQFGVIITIWGVFFFTANQPVFPQHRRDFLHYRSWDLLLCDTSALSLFFLSGTTTSRCLWNKELRKIPMFGTAHRNTIKHNPAQLL